MVEISERILRLAKAGGWIGVDFDGTLFTYYGWVGWNVFGEPIKPMIDRIKAWLAASVEVRILTARIGLPLYMGHTPTLSNTPWRTCLVTGEKFSDADMALAIGRHCQKHGLPALPVQCYKDLNMIEFWDDRAIQVVANTGRTLAEERAAELEAQHGKQFQGFSENEKFCTVCGGALSTSRGTQPCRVSIRSGRSSSLARP